MDRGLKMEELSRMAGIPLGSYSCLESGRYRLNLENLLRILEALQIDIGKVWPRVRPRQPRRPQRVTGSWVRQVVHASARRRPRPLSLEDVIKAVCQVTGLSIEDVTGPSRRSKPARARALAAFAVRGMPHLTLSGLARRVGRDVSSLTHCMKRLGAPAPRSALGIQLGAVRRLLRQKAAARRRAAKAG